MVFCSIPKCFCFFYTEVREKDIENMFLKSFRINSLPLKYLPWYIAAAANIVSLCSRGFLFQEQLLSPIPKNMF